MATVNRSNIGNLHDQLSIILSKEDYMSQYEKALKQYSKNASIPGFRKGHVPAGIVKKMYGQSVFVDEVLKAAYSQVDAYLKETNPSIFAQPLPAAPPEGQQIDFNNPADYTFNFEIGLKPEFTVTAIENKAPITKYQISITDEMIDREAEILRKRAGKLEDKETQTEPTDLVYLNYFLLNEDGTRKEDIKPIEDVAEYGRLPISMQDSLKAASAGLQFTIQPGSFAEGKEKEEFFRDALKIREGNTNNEYDVEVTKIASLTPRDMDEAFFKEVFPTSTITDEAGFREELKKSLENQVERFSVERLQNDIFETLVHGTQIELPVAFLKNWLQKGGEEQKTKEQVEQEWPSFDHQLRWTLISDQLIGKYGLEVSYDEVMQDIRNRVTSYFGMQSGDEAPWMQSYLDKMAKDQNTLDETHRRLLMDKLFTAIEKDMNVTVQQVTEEEFAQIPHAHHH